MKKRGPVEKSYIVLDKANKIVERLIDNYPDVFVNINKDLVLVLGIENDPPKTKNWLARIRRIRGVIKAIIERHNIKTQFAIEIYCHDWNSWEDKTKQWVLFHELLHIPTEEESQGMVKHDVNDFSIIVNKIGSNKYLDTKIPGLLEETKIKF